MCSLAHPHHHRKPKTPPPPHPWDDRLDVFHEPHAHACLRHRRIYPCDRISCDSGFRCPECPECLAEAAERRRLFRS